MSAELKTAVVMGNLNLYRFWQSNQGFIVVRFNFQHSPLVVDLRNDPGEVAARVSLHGAALQLPDRRAAVGRGH